MVACAALQEIQARSKGIKRYPCFLSMACALDQYCTTDVQQCIPKVWQYFACQQYHAAMGRIGIDLNGSGSKMAACNAGGDINGLLHSGKYFPCACSGVLIVHLSDAVSYAAA